MASFDIVESAGKAYMFAWQERSYWGRMAIVPILVKLVCYTAVVALGWQAEFLKQALVMLPAFFTEGWLLSHMVRLIFLGQRWPFRPTGDEDEDFALLEDRARGVLSGTVLYVLINFLLIGLFAIMDGRLNSSPAFEEFTEEHGEASLILFMIGLGSMVASVWGFRFIWLYIPAAVNYNLGRFVKNIAGFSTSFYMIGVWLLCFVPLMFFLALLASSLVTPYQDDLSRIPPLLDFFVSSSQVVMNTIVSVIATAGMAYGIEDLMKKGKKRLF